MRTRTLASQKERLKMHGMRTRMLASQKERLKRHGMRTRMLASVKEQELRFVRAILQNANPHVGFSK